MNLTVYQSIYIQQIRIEGISNSSVLHIGTAGEIRALSNIYNTGGFTGPAPELGGPEEGAPMVPLPSPFEGGLLQTRMMLGPGA